MVKAYINCTIICIYKKQYKLQYAAAVANVIHYPGNNKSHNYNNLMKKLNPREGIKAHCCQCRSQMFLNSFISIY